MMTNFMQLSPFGELWMLGDQLERQVSQWSRSVLGTRVMPTASVVGNEDGWRLRVALPGVAPEHLEVNVAGETVHIRAIEREGETVATRYEETVTLPDTVDPEKITATFRHGLLELTLPLKETLKPRRVEISTDAPKQLTAAA